MMETASFVNIIFVWLPKFFFYNLESSSDKLFFLVWHR